jgi:hypothetical protein
MDKAQKLAEEAEDRERMARIVKRHEKPGKKNTTGQGDVKPPVDDPGKARSIDRPLV